MTDHTEPNKTAGTVMIVDHEVLIRLVIAEYLRDCGFRVIEAADTDEAMTVLEDRSIPINILLCDVNTPGEKNAFAVATWVRAEIPSIAVLMAGSVARTADTAADICDDGEPNIAKPYDGAMLQDRIKRLLAERKG